MIIGISGKIGSGKDTVGLIIQYLTRNKETAAYSFSEYCEEFTKVNSDIGIPSWEVRKFADELKDTICRWTNCTREQLEDREFKEKELGEEWWYYCTSFLGSVPQNLKAYVGFVPEQSMHKYTLVKLTRRLLLQLLGTDCGRDILHPNIWVNSLMSSYEKHEELGRKEKINILETQDTEVKNGDWSKVEEFEMDLRANPKFSTESKWIITDTRFPNELEAIKSRGGITIRVERPAYLQQNNAGIIVSTHESETALDTAIFDYVINNNGTIEELIDNVQTILTLKKIL